MVEIKKGDKVQLKSGSPVMMVEEIGDYTMSGNSDDGACCVWFDGKKLMKQVFDRAVLEFFEEPR